jgi:hypothetical protein
MFLAQHSEDKFPSHYFDQVQDDDHKPRERSKRLSMHKAPVRGAKGVRPRFFSIDENQVIGLVHMGFSTREIMQLLRHTKKDMEVINSSMSGLANSIPHFV